MRDRHDVGIERSMLGQVLAQPLDVHEVDALVRPVDLFDEDCARIFRTILAMVGRSRALSVATVADEMASADGGLSRPGLHLQLSELVRLACGRDALSDAARTIARLARARRVADALFSAVAQISDTRIADDAFVDNAVALVTTAADHRQDDSDISLGDAMDAVVERVVQAGLGNIEPIGTPTGLTALDHAIGGMQPGQIIVIAAKTGCGKSALAATIAGNVGQLPGKAHALFVSLEMRQHALATRAIAGLTGISQARIRRAGAVPLKVEEIEFVQTVVRAPENRPRVILRCDPYATIATIRSHARRTQARHGLSLLVVDYLQLVANEDERKSQTREREVAEISRGLKRIAMDLEIPVIALSQLNRQTEERDVPQLRDLRESGAVEQDADIVAFIAPTKLAACPKCGAYRDEKDERCSRCPDVTAFVSPPADVCRDAVRLVLAKNREDPQGRVFVKFARSITRFADLPPVAAVENDSAAREAKWSPDEF